MWVGSFFLLFTSGWELRKVCCKVFFLQNPHTLHFDWLQGRFSYAPPLSILHQYYMQQWLRSNVNLRVLEYPPPPLPPLDGLFFVCWFSCLCVCKKEYSYKLVFFLMIFLTVWNKACSPPIIQSMSVCLLVCMFLFLCFFVCQTLPLDRNLKDWELMLL